MLSYSLAYLPMTCTQRVDLLLLSTWPMAPRREPLSLPCQHSDTFPGTSALFSPGACEAVTLAAAWPVATQGSLAASRREPEWTAGGKSWPTGISTKQPPMGFEGPYFKWEQGLWTLSFIFILLRRWTLRWGVSHCCRSHSAWINPLSSLPASASWGWLTWRQATKSPFLCGNKMAAGLTGCSLSKLCLSDQGVFTRNQYNNVCQLQLKKL